MVSLLLQHLQTLASLLLLPPLMLLLLQLLGIGYVIAAFGVFGVPFSASHMMMAPPVLGSCCCQHSLMICAAVNTAALVFLTTIGFPRSSLWLESLLFLPSLLLLVVPMFLATLLSDYDCRTCFSAIAIRLSIIRLRKPTIGLSIIGTSTNLSVCPSLNVVGVITSSPKKCKSMLRTSSCLLLSYPWGSCWKEYLLWLLYPMAHCC
jgi:hypothetical protein